MKSTSSKEVISKLRSQGWQELKGRGKGSHTMLRSPDSSKTVVVPKANPQKPKTLRSIESKTGTCFL